jgi:hypothetical protein
MHLSIHGATAVAHGTRGVEAFGRLAGADTYAANGPDVRLSS